MAVYLGIIHDTDTVPLTITPGPHWFYRLPQQAIYSNEGLVPSHSLLLSSRQSPMTSPYPCSPRPCVE